MSDPRCAYTYLLASRKNGTLSCESTLDLIRRVHMHREGQGAAFTRKYAVGRLVWYEAHGLLDDAFRREQSIKRWRRAWKLALIERSNPTWDDLYLRLF